jgi:hypothetical protein
MAKPSPSPKQAAASVQPRRRRWPRWVLLAVLLLAGMGAFVWPQVHGYALTGAAYGARVACSCRFVGGRQLGDCRKDFEPGMDLITLSEDTAARSVTARFPLLARQTATYREGWGCVLEPWSE